jgi:TldD protein
MLDPDLAAEVLRAALARGGRFADLFVEERGSSSVHLDDGKVEELTTGLDRGAGVRVIDGESQAYAHTNRWDRESLLRTARAAAAAASGIPAGTAVLDFTPVEPTARHEARVPRDSVPAERRVEWVREADETARAHSGEVRQVTVAFADSEQRILVANSEGLWAEERRPRVRLFVQVVAARDGVIQTGYKGPGGLCGMELLERYPPAETAAEAARQAVTMLDGVPAPAGEMSVVIGPGGGGVLFHEACGHGLEADIVQKEASIYRGKLGQTLASPLVTGVEDATLPNAWGSYGVDDEGVPSTRTVLFDRGVLTDYLYDRLRAEVAGVASNGHGRRQSYAHLPIPRMANSHILPGTDDAAAIIAGTERGLYCGQLGGGQVNPATGDFVFGVREAYLIENGELTKPARGANLIGQGQTILSLVDAVAGDFEEFHGVCGKDGQGVPVSNGSPTLRITRMTVGGTG